jgi:hypothetical protein
MQLTVVDQRAHGTALKQKSRGDGTPAIGPDRMESIASG